MFLFVLLFFSPVEYFSLPTLTDNSLGFQGTGKCLKLKVFMDFQELMCVYFRDDTSGPCNAMLWTRVKGIPRRDLLIFSQEWVNSVWVGR